MPRKWSDDFDFSDEDLDFQSSRRGGSRSNMRSRAGGRDEYISTASPTYKTNSALAMAQKYISTSGPASPAAQRAQRRKSRGRELADLELDMSDLGLSGSDSDHPTTTTSKGPIRLGSSAYGSRLDKSKGAVTGSLMSNKPPSTAATTSIFSSSHNTTSTAAPYKSTTRGYSLEPSSKDEDTAARHSTSLAEALLNMSDGSVEIDFSDGDESIEIEEPPAPHASIPIAYTSAISNNKTVRYEAPAIESRRPPVEVQPTNSSNHTKMAAGALLDDSDESIEIEFEEDTMGYAPDTTYGVVSGSGSGLATTGRSTTQPTGYGYYNQPAATAAVTEAIYSADDELEEEMLEEEIMEEEEIAEEIGGDVITEPVSMSHTGAGKWTRNADANGGYSGTADPTGASDYSYGDDEFHDLADHDLQDLEADFDTHAATVVLSPVQPKSSVGATATTTGHGTTRDENQFHHSNVGATRTTTYHHSTSASGASATAYGSSTSIPQSSHSHTHVSDSTHHPQVIRHVMKDCEIQTESEYTGLDPNIPPTSQMYGAASSSHPYLGAYAPAANPYNQMYGGMPRFPPNGTPFHAWGPSPSAYNAPPMPPAFPTLYTPSRFATSRDASNAFQAQLSGIVNTLKACRQVLESQTVYTQNDYAYPTFQQTQEMIMRNRRPPLTMEQALRRVELDDY